MYHTYHLSELQHRIAAFDDQHAYKELFQRFQPGLVQFAYAILHSKELAEEVVSDVFIRIWEKRKTLDHIHNLKLYLFVAAKNLSINCLRSKNKYETLDLNQLKVEFAAPERNPQEQLISAEAMRRIQEVIEQLPPKCKMIFKLVKEEGLRQKEIAELLHISPRTVENQMAVAIKKIGKALGVQAIASMFQNN
ncbi:MAG TPA: RNA polymerase sigma-70 factor [Phnomibacter sp.]|nr:RNA polymerase sigma-70 factor [Phnomibacter sp.]